MAGQDERDGRDGRDGRQGQEQSASAAAARPGGTGTGKPGPSAAAKLVFTDPLSRQTADDTDSGWGESASGRGLDWYLSQRPPHHGG
ncbi:hypothetical protein [Kitasatospora sp. LaBMicrA B282]|uniref:hypothetical protein n=1 Tax=Kitasatospora sp. LaBMicrA B282 TaxID=3420949 RepID=UPI003D0A8D02